MFPDLSAGFILIMLVWYLIHAKILRSSRTYHNFMPFLVRPGRTAAYISSSRHQKDVFIRKRRSYRGGQRLRCSFFIIGIVLGISILLLVSCASNPQPKPESPHAWPGGSSHQGASPSGSYETSVSIEVPSYHGLEPRLALTYNSRSGNGWLGVGWNLSGHSSIMRTSPGKGAPKFDSLDVFYLDGMEMIPCTTGMTSPSCSPDVALPGLHAYTTRIESFERIARDGNTGPWYVWKKTGTKLTYAPRRDEGRGPFAWDLASVEDTLGNRVAYHYWTDNYAPSLVESGESYLDSISYDNGTVVKFYYEPRIDPFTYANGSGLVMVRYRLMTIDVTVSGEQVRAYKLSYRARDESTRRSLLYQVQQYGNDVTVDTTGQLSGVAGTILPGGTSLPPLTLTPQTSENSPGGPWQSQPSSHFTTAPRRVDGLRPPSVFNQLRTNLPQVQGGVPWYTGDVNGDGRDDWI
jgi:hypothetical protein